MKHDEKLNRLEQLLRAKNNNEATRLLDELKLAEPDEVGNLAINKPRESDTQTALHLVASLGNYECVANILSTPDLDPNPRDKNGYTPLHRALEPGSSFEVIKALAESGADLKAVIPSRDRSVADLAAIYEHFTILNYFFNMDRTVLPNMAFLNVSTPLSEASFKEMSAYMLKYLATFESDMERAQNRNTLARICEDPKTKRLIEGINLYDIKYAREHLSPQHELIMSDHFKALLNGTLQAQTVLASNNEIYNPSSRPQAQIQRNAGFEAALQGFSMQPHSAQGQQATRQFTNEELAAVIPM